MWFYILCTSLERPSDGCNHAVEGVVYVLIVNVFVLFLFSVDFKWL